MKIKSAKSFRNWYKNLTPARRQADLYWDENFIGAQHKELSGFFTMYHGDKVQVYDFLRKEVEMAEDGQAIYEFVQNAADSDSTKFYMFYDEKHLIVINNGEVFTKEGIKSILNIGQSYGKEDADKIGRYGIGFKLVHRLVGKSSGLDELLNIDNKGYRGPILFSWSEKSQFSNFLNSTEFEYVDFDDKSAPWLLKILITNFPAQPIEKIKDIDFNEIEPFQLDELKCFQTFLNSCSDKIDFNSLNSGSIFFLKLGEKKFDYLEKQQHEYLNGLSTSMHFLKYLDTLVINEIVIKKDKDATNVLEFSVKNGSDDFNKIGLTEIRDKESDAKFKICFADNVISANEIKNHPNIYKYFPAVKEVNNLSFVIHSNLFELSSNRQNLTETPINKKLLGLLSNQIINSLEDFKTVNRIIFKNLFTSILMSDVYTNESSGNNWQNEYFYNNLLEYIREVIPTKDNGFADSIQNVKINKLKLELSLSDFGLSNIKWFDWDKEEDKLLIEEAKKEGKLSIEEWDIRDVIENADLDSLNKWIAKCDEKQYEKFLKELENSGLRIKTKERICQIKLFKFSNSEYFSINDIIKKIRLSQSANFTTNYNFSYNFTNAFFKIQKIAGISNELQKIGIILSEINIADFPNIFSSIEKMPEEKYLYIYIAQKCKVNNLSHYEKKKIFQNFINDDSKFNDVTIDLLKELHLFSDSNLVIKPLNKLIGNVKTASWLNVYKIKKDEYFPELDSFLISESENIFKEIYQKNQEDILIELTTKEDVKSLIQFYQDNQKLFFKEFIIKGHNNEFTIHKKINSQYQVFSIDKEVNKFIVENCEDNLFVLPDELKEKCRDEDGIIKGEDLYNFILDSVDVDENKEILVDIIKYKAKHKFLEELSEVRFKSENQYNREDYEFKILDLASIELKQNDIQMFQKKVIIETKEGVLKLSQIPPFIDKIKIDDYELSLTKILPDNYENSDHLNDLIDKFIHLGLTKERIGFLFGVSDETEPSDIFEMFCKQVSILENAEQLAFLFLYGLYIEKIDFKKFKVFNEEDEEVNLGTDKYLTYFDFIEKSEILHKKYINASKIIDSFPLIIKDNNNLLLIKEPYFEGNEFHCPYIKEDLSDKERLSLLDFIFNQWNKKNKKSLIKNINWSKIEYIDTIKILGFNPVTSVYPSNYACQSEVLPNYLIKWINKEESKINFLSDMGVWIEKSVIIELRKFLKGMSKEFQNNRLSQEVRFNSDETLLFNSFEWLKENKFQLTTQAQYETFKKVVEIINLNRESEKIGALKIQGDYDFELLDEESTEWSEEYYRTWKEESNLTIFLFPGEIKKSISLDEIEDYTFYYIIEGYSAINNIKNNLYIDQNADIKKELRKLELENDVLNFDGLWQNKLEILEKENEQLRKNSNTTLGTAVSSDISLIDQKELNREAKALVKERLEEEGFEFTEGIGEYSTIEGVFKDGIEFPLVVKSYKFQNEPLKISAKEWIQLMRPNSMFWVHFGNRKLGRLKLIELLRNQDNLTLSFSTENLDIEDRLNKFANLLQYFGNIHFDFNIINPSNYSIANHLIDYRFDEREKEEDLSGDDENLL